MDAHVLQRKQASPLYQTLKTHQGAVRALLDRQADLTSELEKLTDLLDDLAKGYNPNYQDMAVKAAVVGYEELSKPPDPSPEASPEPSNTDDASDKRDEEMTEQELNKLERKDLEALLLADMGDDDFDDEGSGICESNAYLVLTRPR